MELVRACSDEKGIGLYSGGNLVQKEMFGIHSAECQAAPRGRTCYTGDWLCSVFLCPVNSEYCQQECRLSDNILLCILFLSFCFLLSPSFDSASVCTRDV